MAAPRLFARARLAVPGPSRLAVRASSSASAAAFEPALAPGAEPAYDLALSYLEEQNAASRARVEELKKAAGAAPSAEEVKRINRAEIDAWVNDPATRRAFRQSAGKGQMDKAVIRHLAERAWKKDGELDLIMQRVNQLGVVPDLLPDHKPIAAIRLATSEAAIEAGSVNPSTAFVSPPELRVQLFSHPSTPSDATPVPEGLYTLLVVDPDSPSHETQSFTQRLHFAKIDIPLSVNSGEVNLFTAAGQELVTYEPPAPANGSGTHRYAFVVIKQGASAAASTPARDNFDLRTYLSERSLSASDVVAVTLARSEWTKETSEHIDAMYRAHRGGPAPEYGKAPKELRYGYPLSAKAQRADAIRQAAFDNVLSELEAMQGGQLPEDNHPQQQ
jgi:large subunit ribosomal protein L35